MSEHHAHIGWKRDSTDFTYESYNRDHTWTLSGGAQIAASAAPLYLGNAKLVDPEEAYVAALSSCHMLTFLSLAARKRLVVDQYDDAAVGFLEKNEDGRLSVARVVLNPKIRFGEVGPRTRSELEEIHSLAHRNCFIANSVRTLITVTIE